RQFHYETIASTIRTTKRRYWSSVTITKPPPIWLAFTNKRRCRTLQLSSRRHRRKSTTGGRADYYQLVGFWVCELSSLLGRPTVVEAGFLVCVHSYGFLLVTSATGTDTYSTSKCCRSRFRLACVCLDSGLSAPVHTCSLDDVRFLYHTCTIKGLLLRYLRTILYYIRRQKIVR
ncbi:uncharacterized protein SCHCODRAFT_02488158, partial [Schizophyllum commune H4-8]|uniref:uncharacterized protein n=1 Tax=Schizophyllum commune (strain H4-8 / FGSC 9210) TaxID=578458 RepID=UPI00215FFB9D